MPNEIVFSSLVFDIWPRETLCTHGAHRFNESCGCSVTLSTQLTAAHMLRSWQAEKNLERKLSLRITKAASSRTSLYHGKGNGTVTPRPAKPQQVSSYDTAKLSKYISLCPREIVMFVQPCTQNMKPCLTA